ncbi:MAG: hypothetical protein KKA32_01325 [Actinobacteria bacterium]|nr:hypothetical protein [Actinomycetota bacterium]
MLKVDQEWLDRVEERYPGIRGSIDYYERLDLPPCPACGSDDTAAVSAGVIGRSIHVCAATTKIRLLPNMVPHDYYCWACELYFGGPGPGDDPATGDESLLIDPRTATDDDLEAMVRGIHRQAEKDERIARRSTARGKGGTKEGAR